LIIDLPHAGRRRQQPCAAHAGQGRGQPARYIGRFAQWTFSPRLGKEIWVALLSGCIAPEVRSPAVSTTTRDGFEGVMREIDDARLEEAARLMRMQE